MLRTLRLQEAEAIGKIKHYITTFTEIASDFSSVFEGKNVISIELLSFLLDWDDIRYSGLGSLNDFLNTPRCQSLFRILTDTEGHKVARLKSETVIEEFEPFVAFEESNPPKIGINPQSFFNFSRSYTS